MRITMLTLAIVLMVGTNVDAEQISVYCTSYTPFECPNERMASNKKPYIGAVAISRDLERDHKLKFGDKMVIDGKTYTVEDRTARRLRKTVDIFTTTVKEALQWGRKRKLITIE